MIRAVASERSTILRPSRALLGGIAAVVLVEAGLLVAGPGVSRAVVALLLLVPVAVAGLLGGRLVALAVSLVAAIGFAVLLPAIGSPAVKAGDNLAAIALFVLVAIVAGVLLSSVVLSDRRRMTAELLTLETLRQVDRDRAALLRSVSHDLRTPLATIRAVATDLRSDPPYDLSTREELLDLVIDESERLDRIVGNLLSLSRIEAGALLPDRQPVDLSELVDSCVGRLRRVTDRVVLEQRVEPGLPLVKLDYSQFDQVLGNLLENAVRHSPPGSTVTLRVRRSVVGVSLEVTDQGPGFDPTVRARLFEPFASATGSGSSGIGLAICKAIVEAHGGTITASEPGWGGAKIVVEVPIDG